MKNVKSEGQLHCGRTLIITFPARKLLKNTGVSFFPELYNSISYLGKIAGNKLYAVYKAFVWENRNRKMKILLLRE